MKKKTINKDAVKDGITWGLIIAPTVFIGKMYLDIANQCRGLMRLLGYGATAGITLMIGGTCYNTIPIAVDMIDQMIEDHVEVNIQRNDSEDSVHEV